MFGWFKKDKPLDLYEVRYRTIGCEDVIKRTCNTYEYNVEFKTLALSCINAQHSTVWMECINDVTWLAVDKI